MTEDLQFFKSSAFRSYT